MPAQKTAFLHVLIDEDIVYQYLKGNSFQKVIFHNIDCGSRHLDVVSLLTGIWLHPTEQRELFY